jgi:hypothetical protein
MPSKRLGYESRKKSFWHLPKVNAVHKLTLPVKATCTSVVALSAILIYVNVYYGLVFALLATNLATLWYYSRNEKPIIAQPGRFHMKYKYNEEQTNNAKYEIICADAVQWLNSQTVLDGYVVTSLPDYSEMQHLTLEQWKEWFTNTVQLICEKMPSDSTCIFYQTDVKITHQAQYGEKKRVVCEEYIDKSYLCQLGASRANVKLLWHKNFLLSYVGAVKFGRPNFSHMLCFGKDKVDKLEQFSLPDVLDRGDMIYPKATGINACLIAMFHCKNAGAKTIIDPFCGKGSILLAANYFGLDAIGVDIGTTRCREAKKMRENSMQHFIDVVQAKSFMAKPSKEN